MCLGENTSFPLFTVIHNCCHVRWELARIMNKCLLFSRVSFQATKTRTKQPHTSASTCLFRFSFICSPLPSVPRTSTDYAVSQLKSSHTCTRTHTHTSTLISICEKSSIWSRLHCNALPAVSKCMYAFRETCESLFYEGCVHTRERNKTKTTQDRKMDKNRAVYGTDVTAYRRRFHSLHVIRGYELEIWSCSHSHALSLDCFHHHSLENTSYPSMPWELSHFKGCISAKFRMGKRETLL